MQSIARRSLLQGACASAAVSIGANAAQLGGGAHQATILYTNDFHSAFEPVPAFWLPGSPRLGGAAQLATLVERERASAGGATFLLDSGDMFTGTLSALTQGDALMEMMIAMRYDAMGTGNHEFDYGWKSFERSMLRVAFPVLCCNVRHRGNGIRFARPYTILEREGVRLGVVGVMGSRAARFTIMPSKVAELEFTDPVIEARACVAELREVVDAIVVLGHQGLPGPMQSDAENDPSVQRPLHEDLRFCDAVPGIDVYIAAHSHHGLEQPLLHPNTGAIITQTYGYGTRLGRIKLWLEGRKVKRHEVELLKVWSDRLPAHPAVSERLEHFRARTAEQIGGPLGKATARFTRKYNAESTLGSFCADAMRAHGRADVGLTNAGGLRADLPEGPLNRGHLVDAFPFVNTCVTLELTGRDLKAVLEQGFSLEAGMVQVSGLVARYDLKRERGDRLVDLRVGGKPVEEGRVYRVATHDFLAEGGDSYRPLTRGKIIDRGLLISEMLCSHVNEAGTISPPSPGRLQAV
ncbi:MAG: bifunctional UDP-sugar hydrolase/5'-nucleotidase [Bryobacterales bacterium]|nr:bifunctional UDP-sugar hydrolase/5'-nucleotidase [Bryobacterales bacterium]